MPLANMLPFWNASLKTSMLMPSSSMTSLAGRPENSREKRWSKSIRSCAIRRRSDWYVFRMDLSQMPLTTLPTFHPRLNAGGYQPPRTRTVQEKTSEFGISQVGELTILHTNIHPLTCLRTVRMNSITSQEHSLM